MLASYSYCNLNGQLTNEDINWAYQCVSIPEFKSEHDHLHSVIVAVVDDGFRLTHNELKGFGYRNPIEIPGNQLDDDGNGYVDDTFGWDISDHDSDVSVPEGRESISYHGTYIASIITRIARQHYGKDASNWVKIMPVKVLSDQAGNTYIKDGYKGIQYAIDNGADIICTAWSGGNPGSEELQVISEAYKKGILIIGSAGNFSEERIFFPAAAPEVLAVAGVSKNSQKENTSNYGMEVDLSAPAEAVKGAHPIADNAYFEDGGTSPSAALVAGCAAVLLSKNRDLTPSMIKEILVNTSTPFEENVIDYGGKMGAGIVNLENAINYLMRPDERISYFSSLRPKSTLIISSENADQHWVITPPGGYHGFYLEPDASGLRKPDKHTIVINVEDTVWNRYSLSRIPPQLFVPSSTMKLNLEQNSFKKKDVFRINYYGKTIDSTTLYCGGTRYLSIESGTIDDGSGPKDYANNCSCKWQITVPPGRRIRFTFDRMDTQGNIDFVYLVDGRTAIPENLIAKFSGQTLPPVVVSRSNDVLVWFVTDKTVTGQGWRFHYEAF